MSSIGNIFSHLRPSTKSLDSNILDKTVEFIYSYRSGVESVCLVTSDKDVLKSIAGYVPDVVYNAKTEGSAYDYTRYFIDLESVGTDLVRMYTDQPIFDDGIIGYNISASGEIIQKKIYNAGYDDDPVLIDRYDAEGVLISTGEKELVVDESFWGGDGSLINDINEIISNEFTNNEKIIGVTYMKKEQKDQSYIRVFS